MTARLQVWHQLSKWRGRKLRVWHYRVTDGHGRVMASDNTCDGPGILSLGLSTLAAFHRLERIGYKTEDLPSYSTLIDRAAAAKK